ncbi:MlaD family protein [Aestuariivita sp.]|jgi:phospholipid/cholesterol/gamma-HCH transport system substrate-binding protein|uniref:MlaD family protein n=1 Tax=Aestuariivita sp. TaxID=1872407 RepID=UPI002171852B|nr:MlaD family protein [Aestuariivita sp.]MCE8005961.1 MCE family protein [Aestuariivita sp.]
METKANYVLIGVFTLLGALGALGLVLWLAKVEADRQYAYYDILFSDVAGLGTASDVRFNGVPVGQVIDLELDETNPSQVRVSIEVDADTPVNSDTVAQLQAQGVTGVSYVALSGGSTAAAPLSENAVIRSERSALQSVFEGAPELLDRAISLLENIDSVFDDQNREAAATILSNLADATGRLDSALGDFEVLSADLRVAAQEVAAFSNRLERLGDVAETTLTTATDALSSADTAFESATSTIATIDTFTQEELTPLASDLRTTVQAGEQAIKDLGENSDIVAERLQTLADDGGVALEAATKAFDNATQTLELIDQAMLDTSETLSTADQTFTMANDLFENDVGEIIGDLREAATAFTSAVEGAATDIDAISDEVLAASRSAASFTDTLDNVVAGNERQLAQFLRLGLPEFVRFTEEARGLVVNLERLVSRIERDPARFLLGTQNSDFRR